MYIPRGKPQVYRNLDNTLRIRSLKIGLGLGQSSYTDKISQNPSIRISDMPLIFFLYNVSTPHPLCPPSPSSHPPQRPRPLTREYPHDAEPHIEQAQRIRHQPPHTAHPAHRAEHLTATIRAPANRQRANHVPRRRIHRQHHAHEASQHEREEAVTQHAGAAGKRQRAGQVAATAAVCDAAHVVVVVV